MRRRTGSCSVVKTQTDSGVSLAETLTAVTAMTDSNGIVKPDRVFADLGFTGDAPVLPEWVQNWIAAEKTRPWPPVQG